jgi:hypothetical protein
MTSLQVHYPWNKLKKGQGFFVPCLDTQTVRQEGLIQAMRLNVHNARAVAGVSEGLIGVWFYRLQL